MNIAIVGAGFTGLSAAYTLSKQGHSVTLFEKDTKPGGLAIGFSKPKWDWTLEEHYHHWFTNDSSVLTLAEKIGYPVVIKRPKTSVFVNGKSYQLDSPKLVLSFPELSIIDRIRMAFSLALLKFNPFWKLLEGYTAESYLIATMGTKAYEMLWKPQLYNKFGSYAPTISLAWFWARIIKRTPSLAYPKKGYLSFARAILEHVQKIGSKAFFSTDVVSIKQEGSLVSLTYKKNTTKKTQTFDAVLVTVPNFAFNNIAVGLPDKHKKKLLSFNGIGAINLVLRMNEKFMKDNTYWLSMCNSASPIMAVVEHTNFMNSSSYNGEHIMYVGNYVEKNDKRITMTPNELLNLYDPYLKKINPEYKKNIIGMDVFKAAFAQPIIPINYSTRIMPIETPLSHVYLANMQQVYPWDRGTNYAVELGDKAANVIMNSK